LGAIAWPLILVIALWRFAPHLKSRLSAGDLKIKVMGVEVESAQGASDTLSKQIADLQDKFQELKAAVESSHPGAIPKPSIQPDQVHKERVDIVPITTPSRWRVSAMTARWSTRSRQPTTPCRRSPILGTRW
jgi:hypothetical protein